MTNKIVRTIYDNYNHKKYGSIGDKVKDTNFLIGDIVLYTDRGGNCGCNVITLNDDGVPALMGWWIHDLRHQDYYTIEEVIIPAKLVTEDILKNFYDDFRIEEKEVKQLTLKELRKLVTFEFELIDEEK